jgi:hypothetical protein
MRSCKCFSYLLVLFCLFLFFNTSMAYHTWLIWWYGFWNCYFMSSIAINTPNTYVNEYRNRSIHYHREARMCFEF